MVWKWRFLLIQTTNKLVNEVANDSARVSGQDRKIPPALGTNQIAGFGGFRPLSSLEKKKRRKTWEGIYSLLNRKMNKNKTINTLKNFGSNTTTDNKSIISNVLNKHFKSIGTKLAAKLSNPEKDFTQFFY